MSADSVNADKPNLDNVNVGKTGPVGVLLTNLGTPDAPTPAAVRRYLAEFLWDRRVIELSRPIWWLVLHGFVLRVRPRSSAAAYRTVWTEEGSPFTGGFEKAGRSFVELGRARAADRHRDALRSAKYRQRARGAKEHWG